MYTIRRLLLKISIWFKRKFLAEYSKSMDINKNQRKAIAICISIIDNPKSELLMSRISDKRYIKNSDYFVIIEDCQIKIINHVYAYDIPLFGYKMENLKKYFDNRIDSIRLEMENEILQNVKNSLDTIFNNIKNLN